MHIKEVVIDGFKSYAVRTPVGRFDEQFNAITGKNGTGKSNILDALCFVLGITQLSKVRVHSLAELVYKQGQTGVTRACVSLVLDNRDKLRSPVGYEESDEITVEREVVIGGRNKYRINGRNVSQQQLASLFHSVQLNVNNPHFLIMQGTITRVINMKPPEVVGLLEEAAGTKMYENRKMDALRTLEKKHVKIKEIGQVLTNDLEPTMEKLRREKTAFLSWNELNTQALRLERFCVAAEYFRACEAAEEGRQEEITANVDRVKEEKQKTTEDIKTLDQRLNFLKDKNALSAEVTAGRKKVRAASEAVTAVELERGGIEREKTQITKRISDHSATLATLKKELAKRKEDVEKCEADIALHRDKAEAMAGALRDMEERPGDSQDPMLRAELNTLQTKARKHKEKYDHLRRAAGSVKREVERIETEERKEKFMREKSTVRLAEVEAELEEVTQRMAETAYDANMHNTLRKESSDLMTKKNRAEEEVDHMNQRLGHKLEFNYKKNTGLVNPSSIAGLVGSLCHVRPENFECLPALDIVLGRKIFNLVVDNKQTATSLLENSMLYQQTTILPAENLHYYSISEAQLAKAKQIAHSHGAQVHRAVDLVDFHSSLTRVFESIFGNILVCETDALATEVCRAVKVRCITYTGDQIDPNGTATGGVVPRYDVSLTGVSELCKLKAELKAVAADVDTNAGKLAAFSRENARYQGLKDKLDKLRREREDLQRSNSAQVPYGGDSLDDLRIQFSDNQEKLKVEEVDLRRTEEAIEALKVEIAKSTVLTSEADRVKKVASMNSAIAAANHAADAADRKARETRTRLVTVEELTSRRRLELEKSEAELKDVEEKLAEFDASLQARQATLLEMCEAQEAKEREESDKNNEMEKISQKIDTLKNHKSDLDAKLEQLAAKLEALKKDTATAKALATKLAKDHVWLKNPSVLADIAALARNRDAAEDSEAGVAHILAGVTEKELQKRLAELEKAKEMATETGTRINKKAVVLCERGEADLKELTTKRDALDAEKAAIEELIGELDEQKGKALINTWQLVNGYLGNIFRALLPNVDARLEPPAGLTAQDGLELRVAFGGKWKESLSELSGGQKSLLALSLILALLKYKPAPFYILDEVDAALDVSHTKNIGHMIKTVFPDSQFIIVSLKEGMFQNANVLFSTRFQDGTSMVTRSAAGRAGTAAVVVDAEISGEAQATNRNKRPRVDQRE